MAVPDLVGPCRDLDAADLSSSVGEEEEDDEEEEDEEEEEEEEQEQDMGQRSSSLLASRTRPKISLTWVLRGDRQNSSTVTTNTTTTTTSTTATVPTSHSTATYEPPPTSATVNTVEKTTNKYNAKINNNICVKVNSESNNSSSSSSSSSNNNNNNININNKYGSATAKRTLSEPSLLIATSESGRSGRSSREKHRHRRTRTSRHKTEKQRRHSRFGYEIQDVDAFLTKVRMLLKIWNKLKVYSMSDIQEPIFSYRILRSNFYHVRLLQQLYFLCPLYKGWNFNFGNAAVNFDTAHLQSSYFHRPSMYSPKLCRTRSQR